MTLEIKKRLFVFLLERAVERSASSDRRRIFFVVPDTLKQRHWRSRYRRALLLYTSVYICVGGHVATRSD